MELATTQFDVATVSATEFPQKVAYIALHTDYSSDFIADTALSEEKCGEIAIQRLLAGGRGHFGPLEHASITLAIRCDHATLMQLTRHRLLSFDVQSMRYTSDQFCRVAKGQVDVDEVFYIRPPGIYESREHKGYNWTERDVDQVRERIFDACVQYKRDLDNGVAPEHARHMLPACYLQNATVSGNLRAWLHVFDMRSKINAQLEIQQLTEMMILELQRWAPDVIAWWRKTRQHKGLLAP